MRIIYGRLAELEAVRISRRLGRESADKQRRFDESMEYAVERIRENPTCGSPVFTHYRWVRVGRFNYFLYYRILTEDRTLIYAVARGSRRPGYWLRRTRRP